MDKRTLAAFTTTSLEPAEKTAGRKAAATEQARPTGLAPTSSTRQAGSLRFESAAPTVCAVASSTPCAICIVRLTGSGTLRALTKLVNKLPKASACAVRKLAIAGGALNNTITTGVVRWQPAPKSPTGEDYAEVSTVGASWVVEGVVSKLLGWGVKKAAGGEFTRRALANNKLALADVKQLADAFSVSVSSVLESAKIKRVEQSLAAATAAARLGFAGATAPAAARAASQLARSSTTCSACVIGLSNAGKSSLFNALTHDIKAIVHRGVMTTRDVVSVRKGEVVFCDTPGFENTAYDVEAKALAAAKRRVDAANVTVVVWAGDKPLSFVRLSSRSAVITATSKADLVHKLKPSQADVATSAYTLEGVTKLERKLRRLCRSVIKLRRRASTAQWSQTNLEAVCGRARLAALITQKLCVGK